MEIDKNTGKLKENRLLNLNDPRFAMGRVALLLTERYNEIAEFFPMFERSRQLIGLLKLLINLKDKYNFKPSPAMAASIEKAYQHYSTRPEIPLQQRLCLSMGLGE
jgi:hypothetical protein